MTEMHCHFCGGVIPNGAKVKYLPPRVTAQVAPAHPDPCSCSPPIVYEHSPLDPDEGETAP
ncbi:MAG: hypothetical protein DMD53_06380 [Gemmatimonadetes bacterium]|nr:MAG: hypothetical protein DMD53_06380 [Gemmatimonadota bacterium]